ncbi:MAG: hypothetical protein GY906_32855 [bacterium]|nr:hypothetical protein [bacterium]
MRIKIVLPFILASVTVLPSGLARADSQTTSVTVPVLLDHNRMLVDAQLQRPDGSWRKARLWIDSGNPECFISEPLARDLGYDLSAKQDNAELRQLEVPSPGGVRLGGLQLDFTGVAAKVLYQPQWVFNTMHIDANLPSTVLSRYHVIFDYPQRKLTLARPGSIKPRGIRAAAQVHPKTGIVQIDAVVAGQKLSFALDNGASYSFVSEDILTDLYSKNSSWPQSKGAVGCANIWGWWPGEDSWQIVRIPEIQWGSVPLRGVGLVGLPGFFPGNTSLGEWYSQKTLHPVAGILGPNAYNAYRVEIDYRGKSVYFSQRAEPAQHDMDLVGLTLQPQESGAYLVIGVSEINGKPVVPGVQPGDRLLQIDELKTTGATMGTVVDALRGRPGETRTLTLERDEQSFKIVARVKRFL